MEKQKNKNPIKPMETPLIPTEQEIEIQAISMFPDDEDMRASFIVGAKHTIYYNLK